MSRKRTVKALLAAASLPAECQEARGVGQADGGGVARGASQNGRGVGAPARTLPPPQR